MQQAQTAEKTPQYSLLKILGIWASVALPMGLARWVLAPLLIPRVPWEPGFIYLLLITLALVWEGVVAYIVLRGEVKPFTWDGLKARLWLHTPCSPKTREPSPWLYLWTIPMIAFTYAGYALLAPVDERLIAALPFLRPPPYTEIQNLAGPAVGQWWLLAVLVVIVVFNYVVGEELIFRGVLLPKMNGVFGKWDFVANAVLFATYHLHKLEVWPETLLVNWIIPWATKRFKSYWVAVIVHGVEAVPLLVLFPMAIMGLVPQ